MLQEILHVGLTVADLDRSVAFYRDVLGLEFQGELFMEGPETELLFARPGTRARVAYLRGKGLLEGPPVELIQFVPPDILREPGDLFRSSISEICFQTADIRAAYETLRARGVEFLSEPQAFDFSKDGFGKSLAVYFRDPDGIILELMQPL